MNQKFGGALKGLFRGGAGKLTPLFARTILSNQGNMGKQTTITFETHSLLLLRVRIERRAWCPQCAAEREMVALQNPGATAPPEQAALAEWLSSEEVHHSQAADGTPLVCLSSLMARAQSKKTAGRAAVAE
jgi:hypothetical protein